MKILLLTLVVFSTSLPAQIPFSFEHEREIISASLKGDTLSLEIQHYQWDDGFGPNIGCLVSGCRDDHKTYFREKLVFFISKGNERLIRRSQGKMKDVEKITLFKSWEYSNGD